MTVRRILSVLLAALFTGVGFPVLFVGGLARYRQLIERPFDPLEPGPVLLVLLAAVLLTAAAATIALSSAGAVVVGGFHVVWGLLAVLMPWDPFGGGFTNPVLQLTYELRGVWRDLSDGMFYLVPTGFGVAFGAVLLTAG